MWKKLIPAVTCLLLLSPLGQLPPRWWGGGRSTKPGGTSIRDGGRPAGKKKTVVNPDAAAVTKTVWTEWKIALSDLMGVNMAAVKKLTIGGSDNVNPKPGASGMLFIDDILCGKPVPPAGL